tara:strand:+ start:732 stop:851 length:120 start_codon:yes stop_codon:yes gene_type:complete
MAVPLAPHPATAERPGLLVHGLLIMVVCCLPALLIASLI